MYNHDTQSEKVKRKIDTQKYNHDQLPQNNGQCSIFKWNANVMMNQLYNCIYIV
jgi:hypothetical protein